MSDNQKLLKQLGLYPGSRPALDGSDNDSEEDGCAVFGYLRGNKERAVMLELRLKNGNRCAFPYSWLGMASFDPSNGITLRFVGDVTYIVTVTGSRLNSPVNGSVTLFQHGLLRHRVLWLREMEKAEIAMATEESTTIDAIVIERLDEVRTSDGADEIY